MAKRNRRSFLLRRLNSEPNITPLIDVLLVLIVIFMVITPVTPRGLKAELPKPSPEHEVSSKTPETTLVLNVDRDRIITLNWMRINSTAEVTTALMDIFKTRGDRTIYIQGDSDLSFNDIAQIIDAARGGGADRIGLMTEKIAF
ncbi:MAG TPA: biopolymer transporter ExbD [Terriglobia bacterium]|nr:biopolymer transporter ExbD [Terriglobia bacterium]